MKIVDIDERDIEHDTLISIPKTWELNEQEATHVRFNGDIFEIDKIHEPYAEEDYLFLGTKLTPSEVFFSIKDMITSYVQKSGIPIDEFPFSQNLEILGDTFYTWNKILEGNIFFIGASYGDGRKIEAHSIALAKEHGCTSIRTITVKHPEVHVRKYGMKLIGYIMERKLS